MLEKLEELSGKDGGPESKQDIPVKKKALQGTPGGPGGPKRARRLKRNRSLRPKTGSSPKSLPARIRTLSSKKSYHHGLHIRC